MPVKGAEIIQSYIIRNTKHAFDDFASGCTNKAVNCEMLGLS